MSEYSSIKAVTGEGPALYAEFQVDKTWHITVPGGYAIIAVVGKLSDVIQVVRLLAVTWGGVANFYKPGSGNEQWALYRPRENRRSKDARDSAASR